jgi:hypothetical protein
LCVEALDAAFAGAFVRAGNYLIQERSTGQKLFYRFQKPTDENYPFMLELFSRQPDVLQVAKGSHLTPLPMEEDISSLSAILLDADYYGFIRAGRLVEFPAVSRKHAVKLPDPFQDRPNPLKLVAHEHRTALELEAEKFKVRWAEVPHEFLTPKCLNQELPHFLIRHELPGREVALLHMLVSGREVVVDGNVNRQVVGLNFDRSASLPGAHVGQIAA